jgi:hypothetical protein
MIDKISLKVSLKPDKDFNYSLDDKSLKWKNFSSPILNSKFSNYFLFLFVVLNFFERVYSKEEMNKSKLILRIYYDYTIVFTYLLRNS